MPAEFTQQNNHISLKPDSKNSPARNQDPAAQEKHTLPASQAA
jgi:hypothetical protein